MADGPQQDGYVMALDGYRGFAVLVVVVCHAAILILPTEARAIIAALHVLALMPVILLFVMSGFLIASSCKRLADKGAFRIRQYAIFRVARIYPGYMFSIAIVWLIAWSHTKGWLNGQETRLIGTFAMTPEALLRDVLFLFGRNTPTQNINGPVWSLRFEVVFYLVMGLFMLAFTRAGSVRWLYACLAACLAALSLLWLQDAWVAIAAFGSGVTSAYRPDAARAFQLLPLRTVTLGLAVAHFLILVGILSVGSLGAGIAKGALHVALIVSSMSAIAPGSAGPSMVHAAVTRFAPLASSSYTLYVIHYPAMILTVGLVTMPEGVMGRMAYGVGLVALSLASASQVARLAEQRDVFRSWLDRMAPGRQGTS